MTAPPSRGSSSLRIAATSIGIKPLDLRGSFDWNHKAVAVMLMMTVDFWDFYGDVGDDDNDVGDDDDVIDVMMDDGDDD
ncbi:hypothetical protein Tco_1570836 [Tanacetum coccineum]